MTTVQFVTSNMFKRLNAEESLRHVEKVLPLADVVGWEDAIRIHRRTLRGGIAG